MYINIHFDTPSFLEFLPNTLFETLPIKYLLFNNLYDYYQFLSDTNNSEQNRRNIDIKDYILMIENDTDDESRLNLTINRKPIAEWFREQWHRLRYDTRLSQQEEK